MSRNIQYICHRLWCSEYPVLHDGKKIVQHWSTLTAKGKAWKDTAIDPNMMVAIKCKIRYMAVRSSKLPNDISFNTKGVAYKVEYLYFCLNTNKFYIRQSYKEMKPYSFDNINIIEAPPDVLPEPVMRAALPIATKIGTRIMGDRLAGKEMPVWWTEKQKSV